MQYSSLPSVIVLWACQGSRAEQSSHETPPNELLDIKIVKSPGGSELSHVDSLDTSHILAHVQAWHMKDRSVDLIPLRHLTHFQEWSSVFFIGVRKLNGTLYHLHQDFFCPSNYPYQYTPWHLWRGRSQGPYKTLRVGTTGGRSSKWLSWPSQVYVLETDGNWPLGGLRRLSESWMFINFLLLASHSRILHFGVWHWRNFRLWRKPLKALVGASNLGTLFNWTMGTANKRLLRCIWRWMDRIFSAGVIGVTLHDLSCVWLAPHKFVQ